MELEEVEVIELELKYCERCGGLWVRSQRNAQVYCRHCIQEIAMMAPATRRRANARLPANDCSKRVEADRAIVCEKGGHA